jgi:hypothetical protein
MTSQYLFVITYCYLILRDVRRYTYLRYEQLTCWLVGFNVNNLESVCSELEKKEVKFYKKLTEEPFGKHAIIKDPDGHLISLISLTEIISKVEEEYTRYLAIVVLRRQLDDEQ